MAKPIYPNQKAKASDHGIESAYFSNLPGPGQGACMDCFCGWTSAGRTWEEVGREFDEHLADVEVVGPKFK